MGCLFQARVVFFSSSSSAVGSRINAGTAGVASGENDDSDMELARVEKDVAVLGGGKKESLCSARKASGVAGGRSVAGVLGGWGCGLVS